MTTTKRAGRVFLDTLAFSHDLGMRRRHPRSVNSGHLKFVRTLPCIVCGSRKDTQAAHLRARNPIYGKRGTGAGEKPDDKFTLPLCAEHHRQQHLVNEMTFWNTIGVDPFPVALALFAASGDDEAAELIVRKARSRE